ncbi:MAG: hypothetical protein J7J44_07425 [Deltaproteobacteria bacterium]|nr:hypothetical protein [Deltaproteobacteria bacterium]
MKAPKVILAFIMLVGTEIFAQQSPLIRLEPETSNGSVKWHIRTSITSGSIDIHIYPSSNHQSETSIAINPANLNNLLIGATTLVNWDYKQGYYYSLNGGITWSGADTLPGIGDVTSDPAVAFDANGNA